jgi:WD40 repeat protein
MNSYIDIWNTNSRTSERTLETSDRTVHPASVPSKGNAFDGLAFSAKGDRLLAYKSNERAELFDVESGQTIQCWKPESGTWVSGTLSPDGQWLASAGEDGSICIWDAATGRELVRWPADESAVTALAVSPDGSTLVSGSRDGTIRLWNLPYIRRELGLLGLDW